MAIRTWASIGTAGVATSGSGEMTREQAILDRLLSSAIRRGRLTIEDPRGHSRTYGEANSGPEARMIVHDDAVFARILHDASLGVGETYMEGLWDVEDDRLTDFMGILMSNALAEHVKEDAGLAMRIVVQRARTMPLSAARSRRNVAHHYDLGNAFYALWLDPTMTYSCAYQEREQDDLATMQFQKYERISRKLQLSPGDRLVDIGCGWGGMLTHAASRYGVSGTGVTLSTEQRQLAMQSVLRDGHGRQIDIRLEDYRELRGTFNKFVSIGMFEHVGARYYRTYCRKGADLLEDGSIGLLHTIGMTGDPHARTDPWVTKYIFPGGYLPHLEQIVSALNEAGLTVAHVENWKPHYAVTLRKWRENFVENIDRIRALGPQYDTRFLRMWDYWLQSSEASFSFGDSQLYQVLFYKGDRWPLPMNLRFDRR